MAKEYYYLVASLRDYALDGSEKDFDAAGIRAYVRENLSEEDAATLDFFYTFYDIENIVSVYNGRNRFGGMGNFTIEQLDDEVRRPENLPAYLARVIEAYNSPDNNEEEDIDTSLRLERSLYEAFYREASRSRNRFVRDWFDFDRTLRNICAAAAAVKARRPVEEVVVGDDAVTQALCRSTAADFGLKGEVEFIEPLMQTLTEENDIISRERRLDMLRWAVAEEMTIFDYFNMEAVLAYMVRVGLVQRWKTLEPRTGREMFARLLDALSGPELFEWIAKKEENN